MTSDTSTTAPATATGAGPAPLLTGAHPRPAGAPILTPDLLGAIGGLVPGERSALSPLRGSEMPSPEAITALRAHGVIGAHDALTPEWVRRLSVLAESRAAARLRVRARESFECTVYFAPDGGAPVSLSRGPAGLLVEDPAPVADLLAGVERLGGSLGSPSLEFAAELPGPDALVLAALLDQHRVSALKAMVDGREEAPPTRVDSRALRLALSSDRSLFVGALREVWNAALVLDAAAIDEACGRLVADGHLVGDAAGVEPPAAGRALAERFLLVDHVVELVALREGDSGEVDWVGATCLQAGARDVLVLERVGESVRFEVVSPLDMLSYAELLLSEAGGLAVDPAAASPPESGPSAPWSPGHVVPAGGLPAWVAPDASAAPAARLDAGLPVEVVETRGAWARVVCSNGWSAWVDGRRLPDGPDAAA